MFFTKRGINDKIDRNFQSNLTLYKFDQSTKIGVRTLGVDTKFNSQSINEHLSQFLSINTQPNSLLVNTSVR